MEGGGWHYLCLLEQKTGNGTMSVLFFSTFDYLKGFPDRDLEEFFKRDGVFSKIKDNFT
jgi:hypothetical protein